jgi:hypothetical protein
MPSFCEKCGAPIISGSKFCEICGVPIVNPPLPPPIETPKFQGPSAPPPPPASVPILHVYIAAGIVVLVIIIAAVFVSGVMSRPPERVVLPPTTVTPVTKVTTLQPGPDTGKDDGAYDYDVQSAYRDTAHTWIWNSNCNGCSGIGYLQFDVTKLPAKNIISAEIQTYNLVSFNGAGWPWQNDPIIAVRRVTSNWDKATLKWGNQPSYNPTILDSNQIDTVGGGTDGKPYIEFEGWLSYDITDLYKAWVSGEPNNGVRFSVENPTCIYGDEIGYLTSDYTTDITKRPKLVINYKA